MIKCVSSFLARRRTRVRMLSPRSLPRDRNRIWERGDIQIKKAENNSEDAEAQILAKGQK
jgi:hypothetical protein